MGFEKQDLDLVLVPSGLMIMMIYHLFLLYRYLNEPHTTVMGFENHDKRAWVKGLMQDEQRNNVGTCLAVISANISAATFLSSISLTLSSLIGAWISNTTNSFFESQLIFGDTRQTTISIKYISLLVCFLIAFACFVQSARHFVHANYLISTPSIANEALQRSIEVAIVRGSDFWSVGLRALYFAIDLLLWFFGPIPMFICSIVMVTLLYYLDTNSTPLNQHQFVKTIEERVSEVAMVVRGHHHD